MDYSIGSRIATKRKELGITGKQIQETIGISTGNLSGIEKGSSLPSATALIGLSQMLDCSIDWILTGKTLKSESSSLSESEEELLETYNKLDRRGQHRVHTIIYEELDRMENMPKATASKNVG